MPQRLEFQSFEYSKRDVRVQRVFHQWSACMATHGERYAEPLAVAGDPRFTNEGRAATPGSIAVARADVDGKRQTNVVGVWYAVEVEYQSAHLARNARAFELARAASQARVAVAARILAGATADKAGTGRWAWPGSPSQNGRGQGDQRVACARLGERRLRSQPPLSG